MIKIIKTSTPKQKPNTQDLGFGKYFTDHMFTLKFNKTLGWHEPEISPLKALQIEPGASSLHYGQALFEGMKAFRQVSGEAVLFRPEFNWQRLCEGADRLCMQAPPKDLMLAGVRELVRIEQSWIPDFKGAALYLRPTLIGTESFLGVRPAEEYLFFIICSPVSAYYAEGLSPVKIWVEEKYLRAAPGGLGATKAGANYAASLKAALEAKKRGFAQVLWLDFNHEYVEEVGTMNVFFVIGDEVITPALDGSILPGGVRDSVLTILRDWQIPVSERKLSMHEIHGAAASGKLKEVFGTGTAAVISPVGELSSATFKMVINQGKMGELSQRLYNEITGIQYGELIDHRGWVEKL